MSEFQPRYSGELSKEFWDRVNAIPRTQGGDALYQLGCALQDLEQRVLDSLQARESYQQRLKTQRVP